MIILKNQLNHQLNVFLKVSYTTTYFVKCSFFLTNLSQGYFLLLEVFYTNQNFFFLIGIHSIQGWRATTRHGVKGKRSSTKIKAYRKSIYIEPKVKRCLLILDLKLLRS